jgi:predicted Zn-dependent protease
MRSPRLWIAAAIVILGLLSYWAKRCVNPITGETQHVALTADQEIALGMESSSAMSQQFGGDDPETAVRTEVNAIGERLVQTSDAGKTQYRFQFHALHDPHTIDDFALPGWSGVHYPWTTE